MEMYGFIPFCVICPWPVFNFPASSSQRQEIGGKSHYGKYQILARAVDIYLDVSSSSLHLQPSVSNFAMAFPRVYAQLNLSFDL